MPYISEVAEKTTVSQACELFSLPRSCYYHYKNPPNTTEAAEKLPTTKSSPRALSMVEKEEVMDILHSERFQDASPYTVFATLLDEDERYICSISTMYRLLRQSGETTRRGRQRQPGNYAKPELLATAPNQVWSWDITKLRGPQKWTYYYLYVMLDIFSRFVVGWLIAPRESAAIAEEFMASCYLQQGIKPGQLTIHADRGSAMTSKVVAHLLADLGVTKTHTRPYTSNDNAYSEAHFKTLKYRPDYPDRFGSIEDARAWTRVFFNWYNHQHRHTGLALMTPAMIHAGLDSEITEKRNIVLAKAYEKYPERFVKGQPVPPALADAVWINPPQTKTSSNEVEKIE